MINALLHDEFALAPLATHTEPGCHPARELPRLRQFAWHASADDEGPEAPAIIVRFDVEAINGKAELAVYAANGVVLALRIVDAPGVVEIPITLDVAWKHIGVGHRPAPNSAITYSAHMRAI